MQHENSCLHFNSGSDGQLQLIIGTFNDGVHFTDVVTFPERHVKILCGHIEDESQNKTFQYIYITVKEQSEKW